MIHTWFQKADKRALENKVNHKLFDQTTDEINKMIKEILDKLADHVSLLLCMGLWLAGNRYFPRNK